MVYCLCEWVKSSRVLLLLPSRFCVQVTNQIQTPNFRIMCAYLPIRDWLCDPINYTPPGSSSSMGSCRQEYWSGLPFRTPGDLPDPGITPMSPALAGSFFITEPPRKPVERKKGSAKSCLTLAIPWTVACQAPLSMGFSRQEYWRGLPFPSPGDLPNPGIEPRSPTLQADALLTELHGKLY